MNDEQSQQPPKTLEELNKRLDEHAEQFAHIDKRFDTLEELNAHLDQKLADHDKRFAKIDERFDQQDATIQKLYAHTEQRFNELDNKLASFRDELKADINQIYNLVDEDLKRRETDEQERLVITHQLDQHEDWIERASVELKIKYNRVG